MTSIVEPPSRGANAFVSRFLSRVPPEVAASFSQAQLAAVQRAFGMRYAADHLVDLRRSVRLPWGRYYVILMAGPDRPNRRGSGRRFMGLVGGALLFGLCVGLAAG